MRPGTPTSDIAMLLRIIDQAFDRKSWHGTNLRGSIRGLTARQASARPAPGRHSIREIVLHTAYWKYAVYRRLTNEPKGSFPLKGSNWFPRTGSCTEAEWKSDVRLLAEIHGRMKCAIAGLSRRDLLTIPPGSATTILDTITGIAAHDLYHAGQIQLLKRLIGTHRGAQKK